jgi:uncharacterized protein (TIRG00374 family)
MNTASTSTHTHRLWTDPKILAGIVLSGLLTWLALRGTNLDEVTSALTRVDMSSLLWAVVLTYLVLWLRSVRWRLLLMGIAPVSLRHVFEASLLGYMINYVLPIRIGELVRAYLVGTHGGFSRSAALATVVVERVIDVLSILIIFACISPFMVLPQGQGQLVGLLQGGAFLLSLAGSGALLMILVFRRHTELLANLLVRWFGDIAPGIARQAWRVSAFAQGLRWGQGIGSLLMLGLLTLLIWAMTVAQIMVLAFGMGFDLPWVAGWLVLVALAVGVSLPSAPGMVGTFHYAALLVLLMYAVPQAEALSYAILLHAVSVVPIVLVGLALTWLGGLSLRKLLALEQDDTKRTS